MIFSHLGPYAFRIDVANQALDDLHARLALTRWPNEPAGSPWRYGTDRSYLREVVDYWRHRFDWRAREARLNRFRYYRLPINGTAVHVLVEPGSGPSPTPLLLLYGWPSKLAGFVDIIDPMAHPERFGGVGSDAFTVIVPNYPGFGFSDPPAALARAGRGNHAAQIAATYHRRYALPAPRRGLGRDHRELDGLRRA